MTHSSGIADKKQEEHSSRQLKNGVDEEQEEQQNLKDTKMATKYDSEEIECTTYDSKKMFVGGIKEKTTEKDLGLHFGQFGEIQYINIKVNIFTGRRRGFAFIVFKTTEGLDNALEHNHVINGNILDCKKAVPRHVKLFVARLSPHLTDDDIKNYFKRFGPLKNHKMVYDPLQKNRKDFCFLTFEDIQTIDEIIKSPTHMIKGIQVHVRKLNCFENSETIKYSKSKRTIMPENFRCQRDRSDFPPQYGYPGGSPCYYYGVSLIHCYNNQFQGYSPGYGYSYPSYGDGVRADYQYGGCEQCEPSAPYGVE